MAVEDIIAGQIEYANTAIEDANAVLAGLSDMAAASYFFSQSNARIPAPGFSWDDTQDTLALLEGLFPGALEVDDISGTAPTYDPSETPVDELPLLPVPDFTSSAPVLAIPQAPSSTLPSVPAAPSIAEPALPDVPVLTVPDAPSVGTITLPEVPSIEIPAFTATAPIDTLTAPTNNFSFFEVAYSSALLDSAKAKLLDNMLNGGYGIEPLDEDALWDRARARELEGALQEAEALIADAAARGFPYPPGDLNVMLQRAQQKVQDKMSGVSRDIALKRADMYVENRKFTITETRALEQILIGYHNSVMERSLNAAKATLDASIQVFNALVAKYNAQLDAYKTEAQVFDSRVRAAVSQVEIYRVQMEGKKIETDIQRVRVDVYNAQLAGVNTAINIYKAQVEAAQVVASIERLRIESFRSMIDAYQAQVQAKVAEFNMYDSQIKGEIAKVQVYETEARAYTAVVGGTKAKADVAIASLQGQIAVAKHAVDVFNTRMEAYKTDLQAQAQTVDSRVRVYGGQIQAGTAKSGAVVEAHKLELGKKEIELRRNVENAKVALADAKNFLDGALGSANVRVAAGNAAAGYFRALVGAALTSINTLSSLIEEA